MGRFACAIGLEAHHDASTSGRGTISGSGRLGARRSSVGSGRIRRDRHVGSRHSGLGYSVARTAPATPVQLSRVLAMVHAAMHDAVNGAEPRYETYASDLIDVRAHPEAAAAGAAHRVLSGLFPALQASWDAALAESLSTIPDGRLRRLVCSSAQPSVR